MKVRTDFVTNSSSSSFIVGFTTEENILQELKDGFPLYAISKIGTVIEDVESAERLDKEHVIEKIRDNMKYHAQWRVEESYRRRTGCSYGDAMDYARTPEGEKEVQEYVEQIIKDTLVKMEDKSVFVEVSYSDNDGAYFSELEHEVMPEVASTIIRFSHH